MTKNTKHRLLREVFDLILCIAIAVIGSLVVNHRIKTVVKDTVEDIQHTEWVKAAREIEPLSETPSGHVE